MSFYNSIRRLLREVLQEDEVWEQGEKEIYNFYAATRPFIKHFIVYIKKPNLPIVQPPQKDQKHLKASTTTMTPLSHSRKINKAPAVSATAANDTWPTFALHVSVSSESQGEISLNKRPKRRELCIDTLATNDDLATLKKNDPFLYYSIPSVRIAEMKVGGVNVSCLEKSSIRKSAISCPAKMQTQAKSTSRTVRCKTCISFEYHTDKLMAKYLMDAENGDDVGDSDDYCDDLLAELIGSDSQNVSKIETNLE